MNRSLIFAGIIFFLTLIFVAPNCPGLLKEIVINEIMYNPAAVPDSQGEYIELYNPGSSPVDINGWSLVCGEDDPHVIEPGKSLFVPPNGYLVIGRSKVDNGGAPVKYEYKNCQLTNDKDSVTLIDASGRLVDEVHYTSNSPWPTGAIGKSIELIDPSLDNSEASNWELANTPFGDGDLGTPGEPNSPVE